MKTLRLAGILGAALWLAPVPAFAADWDQARVTELAGKLDAAVKALLADPGVDARQASAMQQRRHHSAIVSVREFGRNATDLALDLTKGRGREQTLGRWEQMRMVGDDVRFYAEESSLPGSVRTKAQAVRGLIDEIAPFYAGD